MNQAEAKKWLSDFIKSIDKQDNRMTASPFYFCVEDDDVDYLPAWNEKTHIIRDDDVLSPDRCRKELYDIGHLSDNEIEDLDDYEVLDEFCECCENCTIVEMVVKSVYHGHFYTFEACEEHLRRNGHNYTNPRTYVMHNHRNREAEELMDAIRAVAGEGEL